MAQIKKTICFLSFVACCFLLFIPAQGQASQTEITLTWSTNTYTPPGYPGKALPARGSAVEVAANIFSQSGLSTNLADATKKEALKMVTPSGISDFNDETLNAQGRRKKSPGLFDIE